MIAGLRRTFLAPHLLALVMALSTITTARADMPAEQLANALGPTRERLGTS